MTDRAKELLEKVVSNLYQHDDILYGTVQEIRDFLSTPEPTQDEEPVARLVWRQGVVVPKIYLAVTEDDEPESFPVFRHPAPRQDFVRLSDKEVMELWFEASKRQPPESLIVFARAIEDALEKKNR